MKTYFIDNSSFLSRFVKAFIGPLLILIFWVILIFYFKINFRIVFILLFSILFFYTFIILLVRSYYIISRIEFDENTKQITIYINKKNKIFRKIQTEINQIEFRKERISTSIYNHVKLSVYLSGQKIYTQFPMGKWNYREMDRVIDELKITPS